MSVCGHKQFRDKKYLWKNKVSQTFGFNCMKARRYRKIHTLVGAVLS